MWICAVSHEVRFGLTSAWLAHNTETASDSWSGTTNTKYDLVALTFVHRFFLFFFNVALFIYRWLTCSLILCWEKKCIFFFYDIQHAKFNLTLTEVLRHHSVFSLLHPSAHYQLFAHFGPQDNSTFKSQRPIQQLSLHWWIACAWGAECNLPLYHNQSLHGESFGPSRVGYAVKINIVSWNEQGSKYNIKLYTSRMVNFCYNENKVLYIYKKNKVSCCIKMIHSYIFQ